MEEETTLLEKDHRADFADFDDVIYLDVAHQGPLPKASARAAQAAIEWKKLPHRLPEEEYFGLPDRVRVAAAKLIACRPEEIALTTGASGGLAAVANGLDWKPEDEVLFARGEFPAQFATWLPLGESGRLTVKLIAPRERFITADDFIAAITSRTRLVSASLVRFDDGSRLDAKRVAEACHAVGAYLLLDASQCVGAMPLDVRALGADFVVSAGYKWLLSPYGTGLFWIRGELIERMRPAPFYWMALEGANKFHSLTFDRLRISPGARRWDAPETSSFINLAAMEASLNYLLGVGLEKIWEHVDRLNRIIVDRLPRDRCVLASPADSGRRGPIVCLAARHAEHTHELHEHLRQEKIFVSLREGTIRIAPHLYNTERDIVRLITVLSV